MMRFAADLVLLLALQASGQVSEPPAESAVSVRVRASVSVAEVTLPSRKSGLRELRYALGKQQAATRSRGWLEEALQGREAFERVVPEGGDHVLGISVLRASHSLMDMEALASRRSSFTAEADVRFAWRSGGEVIHEGELALEGVVEHDGRPDRRVAAEAWRRLFDASAARAFAAAYEAGAFGTAAPSASGWIATDSPAPVPK